MFDPYHKWLGIAKEEQPPTHYRLLGLHPSEQDREVIEEAALRQTMHVRTHQLGQHSTECTRLLNEISQARAILLNPMRRAAYDAQFAEIGPTQPKPQRANEVQADEVQAAPKKPEPTRRPLSRRFMVGAAVGGTFLIGMVVSLSVWLGTDDLISKKEAGAGAKKLAAPAGLSKSDAGSKTVQAPDAPTDANAAIARAIGRATDYLKRTQNSRGSWSDPKLEVGYAALGGLTLLEAGVSAQDLFVKSAAKLVRETPIATHGVYQASLAILFLDRLDDKIDQSQTQALALQLIAAQGERGWGYDVAKLTLQQSEGIVLALKKSRDDGPLVGFPQLGFAALSADNSNTQFALLGLWAARRHGVPTERALRQAARSLAKTQNPDGGWGYTSKEKSNPSMTCAGLLGLAMGHGARESKDAEGPHLADRGIDAGLRALDNLFEPQIRTNMHFIWCVQRIGVLFNRKTIGKKDWYDLGSQHLLDVQAKNGSWTIGGYPGASPVLDTCFAVLFLKRSNLVHDLSKRLPSFNLVER